VSVFSPYFSFQSIFLFLSRIVHCLPFQQRLLGARVFLLLVCDAFQIYLTMPQYHKYTQTHNHTHTDTHTHTHNREERHTHTPHPTHTHIPQLTQPLTHTHTHTHIA